MKNNISVVIPVYNSAKTLADLTQRITATFDKICDQYEIILVNDGSRDDSWPLVQSLMAEKPGVIRAST